VWHAMFAEQIPVAEKVLRTVLVYAAVAVLIRLAGKRSLSGLNTLDFVVMLLLSNVVQNAIIGNDNSVTGGVLGAVTLILVDQILNRLALRYPGINRVFNGSQTTLIEDGKPLHAAINRVGLNTKDLEHAVHLQNGDKISQVKEAEIEPGGQLVITLDDKEQGATKGDVDDLRRQLARIEAALVRSS
jgi:uncharacterized membrane protein YcaP (DUF421 family)